MSTARSPLERPGARAAAARAIAWLGPRPAVGLALVALAHTAVFAAAQGDLIVGDPLWYADLASAVARDPVAAYTNPEPHPFVMRIGLVLPLAALYRAFGVSALTTDLPCLLAALAIVGAVYAAVPTARARWLGVALCLASVPLVRHARLLNVDLPCAALMAWSILGLARRAGPRGGWWLAGGMLAWFAAFLVKETALWCAPIWLYAIAADARAATCRRAARAYAPALALGAALGAAYLALCAAVWGDAWARFASIDQLTHDHSWSLTGRPAAAWLERLAWRPPLLLAELFRATLIPAALGVWHARGPARIWVVATGALLALFWFGTTSLSAYEPLPALPRMLLPVLPGVLVLAAIGADAALDRIRGSRWRGALAAAVAAAIAVPGALALARTLARDQPESAAYAALRAESAASERPLVVVTADPHSPAIGSFYFGFAVPPHVTIVSAVDFAAGPRPDARAAVRAIVNVRRAAAARREDPARERAAAIEALGLPPLVRNPDVSIYDAGDGARLWAALRATPRATGGGEPGG